MGQIFLVRHGQASFGAADYDRLSERGHLQSRVLGAWFAGLGQGFDRAVTGTLRRHVETAESCLAALPEAAGTPMPVEVDPGFDEFAWREMMARSRPDLARPQALPALLAGSPDPHRQFQEIFAAAFDRWVGGAHDGEYRESWPAFRARAIGAVTRLIETAAAGERIAVFTSGGAIAAICQACLAVPDHAVQRLNVSLVNASVTGLLFNRTSYSLNYFNNFAHLEQARPGGLVTYR